MMTSPRPIHDDKPRPLFSSLTSGQHRPRDRPVAEAPLPTTKQLNEQRRQKYFRRLDDQRQNKQFDRRADDMMFSTYIKQQKEWEHRMAHAANLLSDDMQEDEVESSDMQVDRSQIHQSRDQDHIEVPPEVEYSEQLDSDDMAIIFTWTEQAHDNDWQTMQDEDHFGSEDDTEEFRTLLDQVAERWEQACGSQPQSQSLQEEAMDLT